MARPDFKSTTGGEPAAWSDGHIPPEVGRQGETGDGMFLERQTACILNLGKSGTWAEMWLGMFALGFDWPSIC